MYAVFEKLYAVCTSLSLQCECRASVSCVHIENTGNMANSAVKEWDMQADRLSVVHLAYCGLTPLVHTLGDTVIVVAVCTHIQQRQLVRHVFVVLGVTGVVIDLGAHHDYLVHERHIVQIGSTCR